MTYVVRGVVEDLLAAAGDGVAGLDVSQTHHVLPLLGHLVMVSAAGLLETVIWRRGTQVRSGQVRAGQVMVWWMKSGNVRWEGQGRAG